MHGFLGFAGSSRHRFRIARFEGGCSRSVSDGIGSVVGACRIDDGWINLVVAEFDPGDPADRSHDTEEQTYGEESGRANLVVCLEHGSAASAKAAEREDGCGDSRPSRQQRLSGGGWTALAAVILIVIPRGGRRRGAHPRIMPHGSSENGVSAFLRRSEYRVTRGTQAPRTGNQKGASKG